MAQLVKNPPATRETWVRSLSWEDPWRRERLPTPVFWPGEFHGLYSPWGHKVLYKAMTRVNGDDGTCSLRAVTRFKLNDRVCVIVLAVKCHCFSPLAPWGSLASGSLIILLVSGSSGARQARHLGCKVEDGTDTDLSCGFCTCTPHAQMLTEVQTKCRFLPPPFTNTCLGFTDGAPPS